MYNNKMYNKFEFIFRICITFREINLSCILYSSIIYRDQKIEKFIEICLEINYIKIYKCVKIKK